MTLASTRQSAAPRRFQPLVLCYHAVSEMWADGLAVRPRELENQLRSVLRRYRPVGAAEVVEGRGKLLHVTFDDAFRSVHSAIEMLDELGISATVFACTDYADDGRPLAIPELAREAASHPDELTTMRWDELRALADRGVEVGSHTLTHAHLTYLSDADLARELRDSRQRIEDELGRSCRFLAYPYGEEDGRVQAAARAAGYVAAFGLPGTDRPINRYSLPRVGVWRTDSLLRMTLKTSRTARGLLQPLARAAGRHRGRSRAQR
jgi:peptidoglycan/xylan/chitin deacetylase (PgdA/CDA1 family)